MSLRDFDLSDILTITTGRLVSSRHIAGVYDICNFLLGADIFTHQIPRAMKACAPAILRQHPALGAPALMVEAVGALEAGLDERTDLSSSAIAQYIHEWVAEQKRCYGDTLPLQPITTEETFDTPVADLLEMIGPDRIAIVSPERTTP